MVQMVEMVEAAQSRLVARGRAPEAESPADPSTVISVECGAKTLSLRACQKTLHRCLELRPGFAHLTDSLRFVYLGTLDARG